MSLVSFWEEGSGVPSSKIILVRNSDEELFTLYLEGEDFKEVQLAYKVLENGYEYEDIFLDYIALMNFTHAELANYRWKSIQMDLWSGVRTAMGQLDVGSYFSLASKYKNFSPPIFRETENFIDLLDEIATCIISPYLTLSIYDDLESKLWTSRWWSHESSWISRLRKVKRRLLSFSRAEFVIPLLEKIEQLLHLLQVKDGRKEDNLLLISAFCFNSARINLKQGNANVSILLLHRALDFFLLAECVVNKLAIQSANGELRYKIEGFGYTKVSILNSLDALIGNGILSSNEVRYRLFKKFNNLRNQLLYTHSVYSVTSTEAESFLVLLQSQINSIDGEGGRWKKLLVEFNLYVSMPLQTIFEVENSFDTFIVKFFDKGGLEVKNSLEVKGGH